jgi:hypothetical protein
MAQTTFADAVLADGPVGFWRLGEPLGSAIATDASGNGNHAAPSGGVTFGQPGFHGGDSAALFDCRTGRLTVLNSNSLNPPHVTLEAKIRWDGPNGFYQRILEKSSFPQLAQYGFGITPAGLVRVELRIESAPVNVEAESQAAVPLGAESHVTVTYDGSAIRVYLDGALDSESAAPGSISPKPPAAVNLVESGVGIGNQTQRDRPFNGLIDEVAVYPTALSAARVYDHYAAQFAERVLHQYAAKLLCGSPDRDVLAPGTYFTAVNVHNPSDADVELAVKVAVALPELQVGPVSPFKHARLGPDEALEIDCADARAMADTRDEFLKGFVVIECGAELDVVAVYTAVGANDRVETLHTERVPSRKVALPAR